MLIDVMTEEDNGAATKLALSEVDSEAVVVQPLKERPLVCVMFLFRVAGNHYIIEVDEHNIETTSYFVHETLKGLSGVL